MASPVCCGGVVYRAREEDDSLTLRVRLRGSNDCGPCFLGCRHCLKYSCRSLKARDVIDA